MATPTPINITVTIQPTGELLLDRLRRIQAAAIEAETWQRQRKARRPALRPSRFPRQAIRRRGA